MCLLCYHLYSWFLVTQNKRLGLSFFVSLDHQRSVWWTLQQLLTVSTLVNRSLIDQSVKHVCFWFCCTFSKVQSSTNLFGLGDHVEKLHCIHELCSVMIHARRCSIVGWWSLVHVYLFNVTQWNQTRISPSIKWNFNIFCLFKRLKSLSYFNNV